MAVVLLIIVVWCASSLLPRKSQLVLYPQRADGRPLFDLHRFIGELRAGKLEQPDEKKEGKTD